MEFHHPEHHSSSKPRTTRSNQLHFSEYCLSPASSRTAHSLPKFPLFIPSVTDLDFCCFSSYTYALYNTRSYSDCCTSAIHYRIDSATTNTFGGQTTLIWS